MSVILILILVSLGIAATFLAGFIFAVRAGQFEDTYTPSLRVLAEDGITPPAAPQNNENLNTKPTITANRPL
jgi:cbb3-type cytochrome oxidase maturation protein